MLTAGRIKKLVLSGESYTVDFKLKVPEKLRDLAEEVCSFANDLSVKMSLNKRSVERLLKKISDLGIIKREGSRKTGHWVILK